MCTFVCEKDWEHLRRVIEGKGAGKHSLVKAVGVWYGEANLPVVCDVITNADNLCALRECDVGTRMCRSAWQHVWFTAIRDAKNRVAYSVATVRGSVQVIVI